MKSECPKLECNDAVSVPGQCCKICPETLRNADRGTNADSSGADDGDVSDNNNKGKRIYIYIYFF